MERRGARTPRIAHSDESVSGAGAARRAVCVGPDEKNDTRRPGRGPGPAPGDSRLFRSELFFQFHSMHVHVHAISDVSVVSCARWVVTDR